MKNPPRNIIFGATNDNNETQISSLILFANHASLHGNSVAFLAFFSTQSTSQKRQTNQHTQAPLVRGLDTTSPQCGKERSLLVTPLRQRPASCILSCRQALQSYRYDTNVKQITYQHYSTGLITISGVLCLILAFVCLCDDEMLCRQTDE